MRLLVPEDCLWMDRATTKYFVVVNDYLYTRNQGPLVLSIPELPAHWNNTRLLL